MMNALSVVIITRNEENNIVDCIRSARLVSTDIIVVDSGSEDNTAVLAEEEGARVYSILWQGYGHARNLGARKAKHNWIFSLDADERVSAELAQSIKECKPDHESQVFKFKRKNFLSGQKIRFGTLGFENVKRIYNRKAAEWDFTLVHEKLVGRALTIKPIRGHITHFGLKSYEDYRNKAILYAQMSAEKYLSEGRKPSLSKRYFSPLFNSVKSYIFQFGFLDGKQGWMVARTIAYYSWLKYFYLQQLMEVSGKKEISFSPAPKIETVSN